MSARMETVPPLLTWRPEKLGRRADYHTSYWIGYNVPGNELKWVQAGLRAIQDAKVGAPIKHDAYIEWAPNYKNFNPAVSGGRKWYGIYFPFNNTPDKGKWLEKLYVTIETLPDSSTTRPIDEKIDRILVKMRNLESNREVEYVIANDTDAPLNLITRHATVAQASSELSASVIRLPGMPNLPAKFSEITIGKVASSPTWLTRFSQSDLEIEVIRGRSPFKFKTNSGPLSLLHFNIAMDGPDGVKLWDKYYYQQKVREFGRDIWKPRHAANWETATP